MASPGAKQRGLCVMDLDGTLVRTRTILRLAEAYGVESELDRALVHQGEPASGVDETRRVLGLFKGVAWKDFADVCARGDLRPEAKPVVDALRTRGITCGIATASYEPAARAVADALGIGLVAAVRPMVKDGVLTGQTGPFEWAGDCGRAVCKDHVVVAWRQKTGASWTCAVGDGDNDVCMFRVADLSIAVEPAAETAIAAADLVVASLAGVVEAVTRHAERAERAA